MIVVSLGGTASVQSPPQYEFLAKGVPVGGAMDKGLSDITNVAAGNRADAPILEYSLGPITLRATLDTVVVLGVHTSQDLVPRYLREGEECTFEAPPRGHWAYIAVEGGFANPPLVTTWLSAGSELELSGTLGSVPDHRTRIVQSSLEIHVDDLRHEALLEGVWTRTESSFNRMGMGLEQSAELGEDPGLLRLPSSPMCVGAIQMNPGGRITVIGPDGPTIGGYPLAGVLSRDAFDRLVQIPFGEAIRFVLR